MPRHAYCIIAHNEPLLLQTLIDLIDDVRNDIYILYDEKADKNIFNDITSHRSAIFYSKSIDVRWGDISLVEAELTVFESVIASGCDYNYIHLLSGVDLPLKTQDYIHDYFENLPHGRNLLSIDSHDKALQMLINRTKYYHFFTNQYKQSNSLVRKIYSSIRKIGLSFQRLLGIKRDWKNMTLGIGSNWGSFTMNFVRFLVSNKYFILTRFRGVHCCDEIYKQSMALSSEFCDTVLINQTYSNGRKIDWTRGAPYIWQEADYDELINSEALFARKFSMSISSKLIKKIHEQLLNNQSFSQKLSTTKLV